MSDFQKLARRLITIDQLEEKEVLPSAIFGSGINLPGQLSRRQTYRIGMWPCISTTIPDAAMGFWTALSYLLEQQPDTRVYRIFTQLDGNPDEYIWDITKSQFDIDDWGIDELDENIALWSTLEYTENGWLFDISIENDLDDEDDTGVEKLSYTAANLAELSRQLLQISQDIGEKIGNTLTDEALPFTIDIDSENDETGLKELFKQIAHWENRLLLMLWGQEWEDDDFISAFTDLIKQGKAVNTDFSAWLVSSAIGRAMLPGYSMVGDLLVTRVNEVFTAFSEYRTPVITLSRALYRLGYTEEAYAILQKDLVAYPDYAETRRYLTDIYASSSRIQQAVALLHDALELDAMTPALYQLYGNILLLAERRQVEIEDFYLIDPDDYPDEELLFEAIEAYEACLTLNPDNLSARHQQLLQLMSLDDARFWDGFGILLKHDEKGLYVQDVVDAMQLMTDVDPAIQMLEQKIIDTDKPAYRMMLASLYLLEEDSLNARKHLETLAASTDDVHIQNSVEYMMLSVHHENFEQYFGELSSQIAAGQNPSTEDADFLDFVTDKAPNFPGGYILLARTYQRWEDGDAALEVLLDAQQKLPDDPDILEMLGAVLWDSGEQELAFKYLNQGLMANPDHVPLLVRTGKYLFDNGQRADARSYLARAETINPRNPLLSQTRAYIARQLGNEKPKI